MTLSASRSMQPHRPKSFEREGQPVREEDEQVECPTCGGTGQMHSLFGGERAVLTDVDCQRCDGTGRVWPPAEFAVDVARRRFGPMPEAEARRSARLSAEAGMPAVLLRWDGDGFVEVERFAAAPPSPRLVPVKARPFSSWRR